MWAWFGGAAEADLSSGAAGGDATIATTVTLTGAGVTAVTGSTSTLTASVTATSAGATAVAGSATSVAVSVTTSASGSVAVFGDASLTATVDASPLQQQYRDITTGTVFGLGLSPSSGFEGGASATTVTATITSAGVAAVTGAASTVTETVALTATGLVATFGAATLPETLTLTSAGVVAVLGSATLSESVSITATGLVAVSGAAARAQTVTLTSAGTMAATGSATGTTVTVGLASTGQAAAASDAALQVAVAVSAAGAVGVYGDATLAVTVATTSGPDGDYEGDAALAVSATATADGMLATFGLAELEALFDASTVGAPGFAGDSGSVSASFTVTAGGTVFGYRIAQSTFEQVYTDRLPFARFGIDATRTIILKDGALTVTDYPYQEDLENADAYYLGGRNYSITQAERDALVAAGGGAYVEEI